ncbi:MAG: PhzF family phenazine biosynthesis protein [Bacteroidales bacterium]
MQLPIYQIDAFSDNVFHGNPAAVVILDSWPEDTLLQKIAAENNLSETAFLKAKDQKYEIRWFTPVCEVPLCGHATLASAYLILKELEPQRKDVIFESKSGDLTVKTDDELLCMSFPTSKIEKIDVSYEIIEALHRKPAELYKSDDYMAVFNDEQIIRHMKPDFEAIKTLDARGIIITAPGKNVDFVSRFFAPAIGINEDPVTGSAHTKLAPYWSKRLGKNTLSAVQLSERQGKLICRNYGERVEISGKARIYLKGHISTN